MNFFLQEMKEQKCSSSMYLEIVYIFKQMGVCIISSRKLNIILSFRICLKDIHNFIKQLANMSEF